VPEGSIVTSVYLSGCVPLRLLKVILNSSFAAANERSSAHPEWGD
jgi:hypothetical protein